ncbi:MAG: DUF4430 domain-containing protein [Ruminococcaceae bacterium]|nr:DUF4430 domain-containing protein [Oscillospiraceae bacterium]
MKKTRLKNVLSLIVCIVLIAAMALSAFGCTDNKNSSTPTATPNSVTEGPMTTADNAEKFNEAGDKIVGTGNTVFTFKVVDADKKTTTFEVHTDKNIVGDALQELGLIAGEESQYGLFVKTVNGVTVEYENGGKYWAFYVNGKYAPKGVDQTEINTSDIYSFEVN